jgi:hypothetical protein
VSSLSNAVLTPHQTLPTSGARRAVLYTLQQQLQLLIPQLAEDVPGQVPHMNAGNSDIDAPIYRWVNGRFEPAERLPLPGGEDAAFFRIGSEHYLATASVRTGSGPYDLNVDSHIYKRHGSAWIKAQSIPTFAAKQWHLLTIDSRIFLALAQGVTVPGAQARHPRRSRILEWNGDEFVEFQTLEGMWGYGWADFRIGGEHFLAYADHTSASLLYRWTGKQFEPAQSLADQGGRAFLSFESDGARWLAFANIGRQSLLYRWDGGQFRQHQVLGGEGGRQFELIRAESGLYLVRICFIQGAPAAPKTALLSQIYRWTRQEFVTVQEFATYGGTDAAAFEADGQKFLVVTNSLTSDVRFRQDTVIYRLSL